MNHCTYAPCNKYLQVIRITLQANFTHRLSFVMWRIRNVIQLLVIYFLWYAIFTNNSSVFGYDRSQILTYVLGTWLLRAVILATRTGEVDGDISTGDLSSYLIRPFSYLKYWFSCDLADKIFNLGFFIFEGSVFVLLLRPTLYLQTNLILVLLTLFSIFLAIFLLFNTSFLLGIFTFWAPQDWGGSRFLFYIFLDFFSGGIFPLDILPIPIFRFLQLLPFSYLLFFPLNIYLGRISYSGIFQGFFIMGIWLLVTSWLIKLVWQKGLKIYSAVGQ